MTPEERQTLVAYRTEQAHHALRQADALADVGEWGGVVNRAYYAMFYAANALLTARGLAARTHAGVLALVDRDLARPGLLPQEQAARLREAFRVRQRADYVDTVPVDADRGRDILEAARSFIAVAGTALARLAAADQGSGPPATPV